MNASTLVFYVEPKTLARLLNVLAQVLPARQVTIAIDLTTSKETVLRGVPGALRDQIGLVAKDSAVTVVIEGKRMGSRAHKDAQKKSTALLIFAASNTHSIEFLKPIL